MPTDTMMQEIYGTPPKTTTEGLKAIKEHNAICKQILNKIKAMPNKRISIRKTSAVGCTTSQLKGI